MSGLKKSFSKKWMAAAVAGVTLAVSVPVVPVKELTATLITVNAQTEYTYSALTSTTIAITKYNGSSTTISIPSKIDGKTVTKIGDSAFAGCTQLVNVTIPSSVTSIGSYAFSKCSAMSSISIPNSVTEIKADAFKECKALTNVTLPSNLTVINDAVFKDCSKLATVTIGSKVTAIGINAFDSCTSLKSVTIPDSVVTIGISAFDYCTALKTVTLGKGIKTVSDYAFQNCWSLNSLTFSSGLETIGEGAFLGCSGLSTLNLPSTVKYVGGDAFVVNINTGEMIPWYVKQSGDVYIGSVYCGYSGEVPENTTLTIKSGTTMIAPFVFTCCSTRSNFTALSLPDSLKEIGEQAFRNCLGLQTVTIPKNVTKMGKQIFNGCSNISEIILTEGLTTIPARAFEKTEGLKVVHIPSTLNTIASDSFTDCNGLNTIVARKGSSAWTLKAGLLPSDYSGYYMLEEGVTLGNGITNDNFKFRVEPAKKKVKITTINSESSVINLPKTLSMNGETYQCQGPIQVVDGYDYVEPTCQNSGWKALYMDQIYGLNYEDEEGDIFIPDPNDGWDDVLPMVDHQYVDGHCKWCGKDMPTVNADFAGYTVTLDGSIGVNFYMELSNEILQDSGAVMRFTMTNGKVMDIPVSKAVKNTTYQSGKTLYAITCPVPVKEMTDNITAEIVLSNGSNSKSITYSVKKYAEEILENKDGKAEYEKAKGMIKAMLAYGAYAQLYFEYHTDALAYQLSGSQEATQIAGISSSSLSSYQLNNLTVQSTDHVSLAGSNLSLLSGTTLRLFFKVGSDAQNVRFMYQGKELTTEKTRNYTYVELTDISADQLDSIFTVDVYEGSTKATVQCSALTYANSVLGKDENQVRTPELRNLMRAMRYYNLKAKEYQSNS